METKDSNFTKPVRVGFKKLTPDAVLPKYAHVGDAGMDICAAEDVVLTAFVPRVVKTGLSANIPEGYELQVRPRSGLAVKGITVWNSPGTIDSGYKGEIGVILVFSGPPEDFMGPRTNFMGLGTKFATEVKLPRFSISKGDRIAQLVLAPVTQCEVCEVTDIGMSERGEGGFGSTGK